MMLKSARNGVVSHICAPYTSPQVSTTVTCEPQSLGINGADERSADLNDKRIYFFPIDGRSKSHDSVDNYEAAYQCPTYFVRRVGI